MDEPIRVLRVIARLNVGGPSLHVSYLSSELDKIGYETKLVAGNVGEGEGSMEYIARERGIEPILIPELQRDIEALADAAAIRTLLRFIHDFRPHILRQNCPEAVFLGDCQLSQMFTDHCYVVRQQTQAHRTQ